MAYLIRLLGPTAIEGPNGILTGPIAQRHRLALLAILCRAPRNTVSRDRLVAFLWPEADRFRSRRLLNAAVYAIRQVLGKDALLIQGEMVALASDALDSDVARFESAIATARYDEAALLYDGSFLEGLVIPGGEFDHWTDGERSVLEAGYRRALDALAERAIERGQVAEATDWLKKRLARDPTDGRVILSLMEALDRAGDRAAAIQLAATHASLLRHELDAEPDPAVEELAAQLRRSPSPPVRTTAEPIRPAEPVRLADPVRAAEPVLPPAAVPAEPRFDEPIALPLVRGWIRIPPRGKRVPRAAHRGGLRNLAVTLTAVVILVSVALGASSENLGAALGFGPPEADVVVFPLRVRTSPEFAYMGELLSEEIAARLRDSTLLQPLDGARLSELLDAPPTPRQELELGPRLANELWIGGTLSQSGDSLVARIVVRSDSTIGSASVVIPARHQNLRMAAELLVGQVLRSEIGARAGLTLRD